MDTTTIIGIDPGIVHTGCVELAFNNTQKVVDVSYVVISGVDVDQVLDWASARIWHHMFIEDYNPGNYVREDKKMSEALGRLKQVFPPGGMTTYVDNAGVNTIIPPRVLQLYGVHSFPVKQHHNDLVSAAKIALYGMVKSPEYRELASSIVTDRLRGHYKWSVYRHD